MGAWSVRHVMCDCGSFFSLSTTEYGDIVSVMAPHPCQRGAQLGLKLIR